MHDDWKDARFDRLSQRVDRIEKERWEERQRFYSRCLNAMVGACWLSAIALFVTAIVERAH